MLQAAESTEIDGKEAARAGGKVITGARRSSGQGWNSAVGPRFEKRPAPTNGAETFRDSSEPKHIYYDGELCEAETLPNGFTKIRKDAVNASDLISTHTSNIRANIFSVCNFSHISYLRFGFMNSM